MYCGEAKTIAPQILVKWLPDGESNPGHGGESAKSLEMLVFQEIPCQNCTLEMRIKYLRLTLDKVLTADSSDRSGNWSQKFVLGLAGQITGFVFNVIIAVFGIYLSFRINKKFKRWEESEEIKIL